MKLHSQTASGHTRSLTCVITLSLVYYADQGSTSEDDLSMAGADQVSASENEDDEKERSIAMQVKPQYSVFLHPVFTSV